MTVGCEWKLRVFQGLKKFQMKWLLRIIFLNDSKVRNASKEGRINNYKAISKRGTSMVHYDIKRLHDFSKSPEQEVIVISCTSL